MQDGISKIVQRIGGKAEESTITKAYRYLERSQRLGGKIQDKFQSKEEEAKSLKTFIESLSKNQVTS